MQNISTINHYKESFNNPVEISLPILSKDETIIQSFEEQVKKNPNNIALISENIELNYYELNLRANILGEHLRKQYQLKPDMIVPILMDRSEWMVIALLGVLKAGGAYLPIDSEYPRERIIFMLDDSKASLLLCDEKNLSKSQNYTKKLNIELFSIESVNYNQEAFNLHPINNPDDLAYIIYTSGSTGKPKGVMVEHRGFVNMMKYQIESFNVVPKDNIIQFASFSFDASVYETFLALLSGATYVSVKKEDLLNNFLELTQKYQINTAVLNPTFLTMVEALDGFKTIITAGEKAVASDAMKYAQKCAYINAYGPSETSICSAFYHVDSQKHYQSIPIGKSINNMKNHILDKDLKELATGEIGEICMSGVGLARGYLNREALTKEKFIQHPRLGRLYRSGDLGYYLEDGNLEYVGRFDEQVKIRGFRIELGEIENTLLSLSSIQSTVVLEANQELIAYIVINSKNNETVENIKEKLKDSLPKYMIPNHFIILNVFPLTPNGKIDKKALPLPIQSEEENLYVAPKSKTEIILASIFSEVLKRDKISKNQNFFNLGGNSLLAVLVISKVSKALNVKLDIKTLFTSPILWELAEKIDDLTQRDFLAIKSIAKQPNYPLSNAQKRLWLQERLEGGFWVYNEAWYAEFNSNINEIFLNKALNLLIEKHEILRTNFIEVEGEPKQVIQEYKVRNICNSVEISQPTKIYMEEMAQKVFDLEHDLLLEVKIINQKILFLNIHHIICDGWSINIIVKELSLIYNALLRKEEPKQPSKEKEEIDYKEYSQWQRNQLENETYLALNQDYWKRVLQEHQQLEFLTDFQRPSKQTFQGARESFSLNKELTQKLNRLSQDSTLFSTLLTVINVLLYKYTEQKDILIGTVVANREHSDLIEQIGFYVNTLPLRNQLKTEESFEKNLLSVKEKTLEAFSHQSYPFDQLVSELDLERDLSQNPLFNIIMVLQNNEQSRLHFGEDKSELKAVDTQTSKFDLMFEFNETESELFLSIEYDTMLFKPSTIKRIFLNLETLIDNIELSKSINELVSISQKERLLLESFNNSDVAYPKEKSIVSLFEEQVVKTPHHIALVYKEKSITYERLNDKVNQLVHYLLSFDIEQDELIPICIERSVEMVVGILAILKVGGAYVPIDASYPKERIDYILNDCNAKIILTEKSLAEVFPFDTNSKISLDEVSLEDYSTNNPNIITYPNQLAYVIYTSGSTGNPKGVMIEHRGVVRLVKEQNYLPLNDQTIMLQSSSTSFDATTFELWGILLNGGKLVLYPFSKIDIHEYNQALKKHHVNTMWITTRLFEQWVENIDKSFMESLKYILTGGEIVSSLSVKKLYDMDSSINVNNMYGPTESTTFTSFCLISKTKTYQSLPIGKPISNTKIYILNGVGESVPIGGKGELCIGGDGLARGYLNQKRLTDKQFIVHPKYGRLYKTGDIAKYLDDGNIEYLGRVDDQVKIRGFRVELGEIEHAILTQDNIKECLVVAKSLKENESRVIIAYLLFENNREEVELLKAKLKAQLPHYMMPTYFVPLEYFPLTLNGKTDKKALPLPKIESSQLYIAPINEKERLLVEVFTQVLNLKFVSTKDHFFDIGGDSIKAIQITAKVASKGYQLRVEDIFRADSIKTLAHSLTIRRETINQESIVGEIPLTPVQEWFFNLSGEKHHFNQSLLLDAKEPLDEDTLQLVLNRLQKHHDLLRVSYSFEKEKIEQLNENINSTMASNSKIKVVELNSNIEMEEIIKREENGFSLENSPLIRIILFKEEGFRDRLFITIHHLLIDGISWRVLLEDFNKLYMSYKKEELPNLPLKTTSFKRYSERLIEYGKIIDVNESEKLYWVKTITDNPSIPVDNFVDRRLAKNQKEVMFTLDKRETSRLLKKINFAYNTEINDVLLTALSKSLYQIFNMKKILITLEGHGREAVLDIDISRTVGWFTTIYPVSLNYETTKDISYHIKSTKESLRAVPYKGLGYGLLKYSMNHQELTYRPEVAFNYLGVFDGADNEDILTLSVDRMLSNPMADNFEVEHPLNINAIVTNGEFKLLISYDKNEFKSETIEKLSSSLENSLLETITHCENQSSSTLTPSDLSVNDMSIESLDEIVVKREKPYQIKDIYNLTSLQKGMLFHSLEEESGSPYFEQLMFDIYGRIDVVRFEKSLELLISRHDILRTYFIYSNRETVKQVVYKEPKVNFSYQNIQKEEDKRSLIESFEKKERDVYFELSKENPFKIKLFKTEEKAYYIVISFHHILLDGWSMGLLFDELFSIYAQLKKDKEPNLLPSIAYGTYISWLSETDELKSKAFWNEYLLGYETESLLPQKVVTKEYRSDVFSLTIDSNKMQKLNRLTQKHTITLNTLIETLFGILLSKYNNTDDIVFGTTVSGRNAEVEGIDKILGLFINTIPVRVNYKKEDTLASLLDTLMNSAIEAKSHHHYSLAEIQNLTPLKGKLIKQLMVFESYPMSQDGLSSEFTIGEIDNFSQTNYDLNVIVYPTENLTFKFQYNSAFFYLETIQNIGASFEKLIDYAVEQRDIKISEIDILSFKEYECLRNFNNTLEEYPKDKTVIELFEEQVEQYPNAIAVRYEEKSLTYTQLNQKANVLAHYLRKNYTVQPNTTIPIMINRNDWMIVAMLGILKAGGAYLPLDLSYPIERIEFMLTDVEAEFILCDSINLNQAQYYQKALEIDIFNIKLLNYTQKSNNLELINRSSDLIYIIYTSGSTGKPKGVMVENRGVVRLVRGQKYVPLNKQTVMLQSSSIAFDATTFEVWGTLLNGGSLVLYPSSSIDINDYNMVLKQENINTIWVTARLFDQWVESIEDTHVETLKYVLTGGDVVSASSVEKLYALNPTVEIINGYGPTESTTFASTHTISRTKGNLSVPIGKPISNTEIYILNESNQSLPIGAKGELCIGGDGLARGYLNQKELTCEIFIEHPKYGRLYKTGDMAKYLEDGVIEYLGRIDDQVKIRGFRIELGEIEQCILQHSEVKESVVVAKSLESDESKILIAYVVFKDNMQNIESLKASLKLQLVNYMIPNYFVFLKKMPLTLNGKIDKKMLPLPNKEKQSNYIAPSNKTQSSLVEIFSSILKLSANAIGITDNFFEIGGHSLTAMSIISRISTSFKIKIKLKEFFINASVEQLDILISSKSKESFFEIETLSKSSSYALSNAQRGLWLLDKIHGGFNVYNMPNLIRFEDEVNLIILKESFKILLNRHEILRTNFLEIQGEVRQVIHSSSIDIVDFLFLSEDKIEEYVFNEMKRVFDLEKDSLIYTTLINKQMLFINMHHIISDGWSLGIIIKELSIIYTSLLENRSVELRPLSIQYKDYAHWQNRLIKDEDYLKTHQAYWHNALDDVKHLEFPLDYPRASKQSFEGRVKRHNFNRTTVEKLNVLSKESTLFTTLLTLVNILFSKYTNQEDIVIGTPVANRGEESLFNQVGFYVNTLALRNKINSTKTFKENLKTVQENTLEAFEYQSYPFDTLVDELDFERDMSQNPLFNIMLVLQNNETINLQFGELKGEKEALTFNFSKFDMTLSFEEKGESLELYLEYNSTLFKEATMERLILNLETLINSVEEDTKLSHLNSISTKESQLLESFNQTDGYFLQSTLIQHFEEQVEKMPESIALVYEEKALTYEELNSRANSLAIFLKERHTILPDSIVPIMVDKSDWMMVAVLAVLKTGGAYLPLDPEYPKDRIEFMLLDSESSLLLCDGNNQEQAKEYAQKMNIESVLIESLEYNPLVANLETTPSPTDLAYIIYTSGSTGKPKGVMIEHQSILNTILFQIEDFNITQKDRLLQFASFSFDGSVAEIFGSLLGGATLVIIPKNRLLENPLDEIKRNKITIGTFPPSFLNVIEEGLTGFKTLITAGETAVVKDAVKYAQDIDYINAYGPTENSICTSTYHVDGNREYRNIPIGKPLTNTQLYILNQFNQEVPLGAVGELCVGGVGLARGYLNRESLTNEKFINHPKLGRIYKTGDIARYLDDGHVEYLSRIDEQVKIRGFRIELGEIETAIVARGGVEETIVVAKELKEDNRKELVAYLLFDSDKETTVEKVRQELKVYLPNYMIPSYFIELKEFPRTPNGKVDKKALPNPTNMLSEKKIIGATNSKEEIVLDAFKEVLGIDNIGIEDNFFDIGGDSIKAIQIGSKVARKGYKLPIQNIFQANTIKDLAHYLEPLTEEITQESITGEIELTPIQQWFFELEGNKNHFNQSVLLKSRIILDEDRVKLVISKLQIHHDALRINYSMVEGSALQHNKSIEYPIDFETIAIHNLSELENHTNRLQATLEIERNPLMKVVLFKISNQEDRLLIIVHHLVIDGVSWRILLEDINNVYENLTMELPDKTASFKDYAQKLHTYGKSITPQLEYWKQTTEVPFILPTDNRVSKRFIKNRENLTFKLSQELTQDLLENINFAYNTEINDILVTALSQSVYEQFNQEKFLLTLEGHGREDVLGINISRTVGWFTTAYPVQLTHEDRGVGYQIQSVKESLHQTPDKGIGYGVLKYLMKENAIDYTQQISFNYLGEIDTTFNNSIFEMAKESAGNPHADDFVFEHKLGVNAIVIQKQFQLTVDYDKYEYHKESMERFLHLFETALQEIIYHCKGQEQSSISPSDITDNDFDIDTLNELLTEFSMGEF